MVLIRFLLLLCFAISTGGYNRPLPHRPSIALRATPKPPSRTPPSSSPPPPFSNVPKMAVCGALLGPCLDSFHSHYEVLHYEYPVVSDFLGFVTTAAWVPPLFGVAGALIGTLYNIGDGAVLRRLPRPQTSWPRTAVGIAYFISQYWLSGYLSSTGMPHSQLFLLLAVLAAAGFWVFDFTTTGLVVAIMTAVGGPALEVGLIHYTHQYSYLDPDFINIPLWIAPVYFFGAVANGGLVRSFRGEGGGTARKVCEVCNDSRVTLCPNCDGKGLHFSYAQRIECSCCRGSGQVICRACFSELGVENSVEGVREFMKSRPD